MLRTLHTSFCALLVLAVGCTESYRPDVSTETGNPPFIDSDKVALVVTRDEVHVQGEPGAVTPPEGEIEVKILRNQALVRGPIADDGSFDVEVDATLDDVFEVRAVNGDESSAVVIVVRGGAMVGQGDGGTELSCEHRGAIVDSVVDPLVASASTSCTVDADCAVVETTNGCTGGCGRAAVAASDAAAIEQARVEANTLWCGDDHAPCATPDIECGQPRAPICDEGRCMDNGTQPIGCDSCLTNDLTWEITGAGILPALPSQQKYELRGCNSFTSAAPGEPACMSSVPQCSVAPSRGVSIEALLPLLQDADVVAAFEAGGTFGETDERSGYVYELTLGGSTITYRSCAGASAGVLCEPSALEDLIDWLELLVAQQDECEVVEEADCASDFDVGDCDAAVPVYWHNPATGACEMQTYGGCGGNDNRYESQAACEQACGVSGGECPPNRAPVEECLMCGVVGGCAEMGDFCALICSSDADCEDEAGSLGAGSQCDESAGLCVSFNPCI